MRKASRHWRGLTQHANFGDMVTIDHAKANALIHNGLSGKRELLLVSDLATGDLGACPVGSKSADRGATSLVHLVHFLRITTPKAFHTDLALEFIMAVRSSPGGTAQICLASSSERHRWVTDQTVGPRHAHVTCFQVGLPRSWWHFAPCVHDAQWASPLPSGLHRKRNLKFEPPLKPAVF